MTQAQHDVTVSSGSVTGDTPFDAGGRELEITAAPGTEVTLTWEAQLAGAVGCWTTRGGRTKTIAPDWSGAFTASLTAEAPVGLFFDAASRCTYAYAFSETVTEVRSAVGISEELNRIVGSLTYTAGEQPSRLRLYGPGRPYEDVLADVAAWWTSADPLGGSGSLPVGTPDAARQPVYSTWYNFHQQLVQTELDAELELAADLGMGAVIVDDGWQTDDNARGYDYTGDWQVATTRFPDLAGHVARTKELGIVEMLWISLPFVGRKSDAVTAYGHLLLPDEGQEARLWDVRLPEARAHVAGICRRLVEDHGLAGLKIDFIDQWSSYPPTATPANADTDDYTVGVDLLLQAIVDDLKAVTDQPLVEFRQRYIGPRMLRYGNMLRVSDCPADSYTNRVGSVDLRHLIADRAVHTDMVMWAADDPEEDAAEQLLCTAFSVPQISMVLAELNDEHTAMLRRYLSWWSAHRDTLLDGRITAPRPDLGYPVVTSATDTEAVSVGYASDAVVPVGTRRTVVANATGTPSLVVELSSAARLDDVRDCRGLVRAALSADLAAGLHRISLPRGGTAVITAAE